jgi:glycosyltransferase involved in cell wall biosynthesis
VIDELSIIIPTLNEAAYLPLLLDSIVKQTYTGKLQVIVVDGRSTDKTVRLARSFAKVIPELSVVETKADIGHQRNTGVKHAKYKYILFIDADIQLPPNLLQKLLAKAPSSGPFLAGVVHTAKHVNLADFLFLVWVHSLIYIAWISGHGPITSGDFLLTTRDNHKKIGGFVEGAILGEDTDYCLRSYRAGTKFHFYFSPRVIASPRRVRKVGRLRLLRIWSGSFRYVSKHGPIFPGEGYDYTFGGYGPEPSDSSSLKK